MADKKPDAGGHGAPSGGGSDAMRDLYIFLVVIVLVGIGFYVTPVTLDTLSSGAVFKGMWAYILDATSKPDLFQVLLADARNIFTIVGLVLFGAIVWVKLRYKEVHHKDHKMFEPIHIEEIEAKEKTVQWQIVLNHLASENPAEWKLGVMEADNMLDEILELSGYRGESLGEKLKSMDPSELKTYNEAWEAHKVRNQIAHEGSNMDFSKKIARDAIVKFEKVFKELGFL